MSTSTRGTARSGRCSRVHRLSSGKIPAALLSELSFALWGGAVIIFPTETVYGLGASVFAPRGIQRIYALKGRSWHKPLALLTDRLFAAQPLLDSIPDEAYRLAEAFWPGPLTLIFKASALGRMIMGGRATVGVRIPDHPVALSLLKALGQPLATTSVNRSGEPPATSGQRAAELFGAHVDWLLDSGACRVKTPSSVVDLSVFPFNVKREGAIPKKELERVLMRPRRR